MGVPSILSCIVCPNLYPVTLIILRLLSVLLRYAGLFIELTALHNELL